MHFAFSELKKWIEKRFNNFKALLQKRLRSTVPTDKDGYQQIHNININEIEDMKNILARGMHLCSSCD